MRNTFKGVILVKLGTLVKKTKKVKTGINMINMPRIHIS